MIHQYIHRFSEARYWIDLNQGRNALIRQELRRVEMALDALAILQADVNSLASRQERVSAFLNTLGYPPLSSADVYIAPDTYRLVFRDIARNTDERTLIATILPSGVFSSNTLNFVIPWHFNAEEIFEHPTDLRECYEPTFSPVILAYFCGVFNSFTLDYFLRFKVSAHVNMFYLYQLPVPRLDPSDPRCKAIAERVARLVCIGSEFDELRRELLGDVNAPVTTDSVERRHIQSEIDGLVAHLYGLTEEEFKHILSAFPLVKHPVKNAILDAYREFSLEPDNLRLAELIAKGESSGIVEFKVAACWNSRLGRSDSTMRDNVIQEVAAFLNKKEGGVVLIGVEDDGTVVGLADDYRAANLSKPNRDGYQLFLLDVLKNSLDGNWSLFYTISFGAIRGKDVCRIDVSPAPEAVYLSNDDFYIREGNRKRKLSSRETVEYIKQRWR